MFRRSTKITSLIVAAASVATMVPAMAADYKKIDAQEGIVSNAFAFKDGKFVIGGEVEDKDESSYYLSNGKYTDLDDSDISVGDIDDAIPYGEKYIKFDTDSYLDLETGKVSDDEIQEDDKDDAATAIKKAIKKDDPNKRYTNKYYENKLPGVEEVAGNKFSSLYYELKDEGNINYDGYTVYSDAKGNYIDADYLLGKISIKIRNTKDSYKNIDDLKEKYKDAAITHDRTLAQDKDYVYREATLTFGNTTGEAVYLSNDNVTTAQSVKIVQKISKAVSSDDIDDAQLPKTVKTYFLTAKDDATDLDPAIDLDKYEEFTVVDGKLVGRSFKGNVMNVQAFELADKGGYGYVDNKDGIIDESDVDAVDTDKDGNVWFIQDGYVKKYDLDDDSNKVYKIDGNCDSLSIYDEKNLIVWSSDEDDEVYSIIAGKTTTDDNTDDNTVTTTGWVQDATTGAWSYVKADGTKAIGWFQSPTSQLWYYMDANGVMQANGWIQDGGSWYFLDSTGAMKTGWVYTGGAWYFLKPTNGNKGAMQTGWIQTGGKWYYCNASGAMLSNTTVGGYVLGADGAWIK
ncbi:N-acetylmuramoyl-L-alanine amidase family protein [Clostridium neonatale]|uniref:N-acetylmuramoyl-L-alanine amidase family protein n=1 Tax=Clostridium neonatale TaxID=137838 RepID=UPI00291C1DAF|nr:N-acetylmuramoyl-L-alanine amidase family protein [Clostridium neonatale]CAI3624155.1 Cell wall binding repeat-containing protein [Clostridium neonatale]CAI3628190.1 Cell wall binding repeat-containing protein [Clostridium neonatale]